MDDINDDGLYCYGLLDEAAPFFKLKNRMSNRRFQPAIDLTAYGREVELRVSLLILNVIVIGVIIAVAIIPARLADWIA